MGVIGKFHHLDVSPVGSRARDAQSRRDHRLFIFAIELITMPVAFANLKLSVNSVRQRARLNLAGPRSQPHGAA